MINCYIVDDEPNNVDVLLYTLKSRHPELDIVGCSLSPTDAIQQLNKVKIDLLFLDIQMPQLNGFELLNRLDRRDFEVIFITAHDQYGIQAVKISALDYLLKPLNDMELEAAIAKAKEKIQAKRENINLENLLQNYNKKTYDPKIALTINRESRFVPVSEIIRCRADNNYTEIYLKDGLQIMVSKTLKEFDLMLEGFGFLRCHHSHLINTKYIKGIQGPGLHKIILTDHTEVPISRMKKDLVKIVYPKSKFL
ncbi:LytR/AlgR family response regulator transcription factor [Sphingobacterium thalpophilum]|uniref:LytR/AlgR family response regulator transcription factor n=1 Tax=Sphingobacterium TaxID=28453 RepID=UPI002243D597|nr:MULTISPECIES: LytTR family DNA-binding domain-containing protein [Sphingobacterium]MCW8313752.1 LytTR family DNA-binding domain-containing protein [Sphingobacterium sp. InxBP1]